LRLAVKPEANRGFNVEDDFYENFHQNRKSDAKTELSGKDWVFKINPNNGFKQEGGIVQYIYAKKDYNIHKDTLDISDKNERIVNASQTKHSFGPENDRSSYISIDSDPQ